MAIPYERAVAEDLNLGHGTTSVTNPNGGSMTGNKIGLHTFYGSGDPVVAAHDFSGGDMGAQIAAALAALPSTGGIVDARGFSGTQASASNPFTGVTKPFTLLLGDVTISTGATWSITSPYQGIIGHGTKTVLKATASMTNVLLFDATANGNGHQIICDGIRVNGNALATNGISLQRATRCRVGHISATNVSGIGILMSNCVQVELTNPIISGNLESFTTTPSVGIQLDDISGSGTAACTIINPIIDGITGSLGYGIYEKYAGPNTYLGGAVESSTVGLYIGANGQRSKYFGLDFEANGSYDVRDYGFLNEFHGCNGYGAFNIESGSYRNTIFGCAFGSMTLNTANGYNEIYGLQVATAFTDNDTTTISKVGIYNNSVGLVDNYFLPTTGASKLRTATVDAPASTNLTLTGGSGNMDVRLKGSGTGNVQVDVNTNGHGQFTIDRNSTSHVHEIYFSRGGSQKWALGNFQDSTDDLYFAHSASGKVPLRFLDSVPGAVKLQGIAYASLGTPADGTIAYCTDCTVANPCAGGGSGALAKRLAGAWVCN
jgi:hypothetical protein